MWECPRCKREFKIKNQWHSCSTISLDEFFHFKDSFQKDIYLEINRIINPTGEFSITATKSALFWRKQSTFLEMKIKKDTVILAFSLHEQSNSNRIDKIFKMSTNKIVHYIVLHSLSDLDSEILGLIKLSKKNFDK